MSIKFKQTEVIVTWKDKPLPELNELELREALGDRERIGRVAFNRKGMEEKALNW